MEIVVVFCVVMRVVCRYVRVRAEHNKLILSNNDEVLVKKYDSVISLCKFTEKLVIVLAVVFTVIVLCLAYTTIKQINQVADSMNNIGRSLSELAK